MNVVSKIIQAMNARKMENHHKKSEKKIEQMISMQMITVMMVMDNFELRSISKAVARETASEKQLFVFVLHFFAVLRFFFRF